MASLIGTPDDDELVGTNDSDVIDAYGGDDLIIGAGGDDTLYLSSGRDILDGGDGIDLAYADVSFATNTELDLIVDLESGFQAIRQFYELDPSEDPAYDQLINIESYKFVGIFDLFVTGSSADNVITTDQGNDQIAGGSGSDLLDAGLGNDSLIGGDGDDVILAGRGRDIFDGGAGHDLVLADVSFATNPELHLIVNLEDGFQAIDQFYEVDPSEDPGFDIFLSIEDYQFIGIFDVSLTGNSSDNLLKTDKGSDRIAGREGNDTIDGGAGIDTAVFAGNRSNYTITNVDGVLTVKDNVGTDGIDTLTNIEKLQFADATWDVTDLVFDEETDDEGTVQENTEGADVFIGTPGIDKVVYNNARADIDVSVQDGVVRISNGDITDELKDIERIAFSDTSIALDIDGNAGSTAKILGAVFGKAALTNKAYAGIGLSLLDSGEYTYESLMDYALTVAGAQSNAQVVELLYTNAIGIGPTAEQTQSFVALLDTGTYTRASLGALAAEYAVSSVTLAGLAETGLEYTPFG